MADIIDMIWIDKELKKDDLAETKKEALAGLKEKAESGDLRSGELGKLRKKVNRSSDDSLKSVLTRPVRDGRGKRHVDAIIRHPVLGRNL